MNRPYIGNGSTRVLHRKHKRGDACRAVEILTRNRENFPTVEAAKKYGYRLCKICFKEEA